MSLNIVQRIDDRIPIRHLLISVADKTGLDTLIPALLAACPDVTIYSTGGTHTAIAKLLANTPAAQQLVAVSDYTGQPEMQGGLVKTLDFKIYLGLLSETYNPEHRADLKRTAAVALDMVVANLYPFARTIAKAGVTPEEARTNIDIGGPCMIRAAAKNYLRVASVTAPADYDAICRELAANGGTLGLDTRFRLMQQAFAHTANYDQTIAGHFATLTAEQAAATYTCG